jgi:hypothetical protein
MKLQEKISGEKSFAAQNPKWTKKLTGTVA